MVRKSLVGLVLLILAAGYVVANGTWSDLIRIEQIRADLRFLSDDITEGRAPGTRGELIAAKYIAARMEMIGLKPLGDNDTYFQKVPMIGVTTHPDAVLILKGEKKTLELKYLKDMVSAPYVFNEVVELNNAPLVFVGYGIEAPEYKWSDYKGVDVKDKVVVMFVNDPPATGDEPDLFEGRAMTYYGRWTYKYEEAQRQGAAGAILIHITDMAGYPWQVVQSSWSGEQVYLDVPPKGNELKLAAWITRDAAEQLFAMRGLKLDDMLKKAASRSFRPIDLNATASITMKNDLRRFNGLNVVGYIPGVDEQLKSEAIVFTAHYDHLGRGQPVNGDDIYNGAFDNASGTAALLSAAEAWMKRVRQGESPGRSAIFLAVTAEESGLLGSLYYARYPTWPADKIVANLNMDGVNPFGPTKDMVPLGYERSTLDKVVQKVAAAMDIEIKPDPFPEKGYFFRSDHFSFARFGVPAISFDSGTHYIGKDPEYGVKLQEEYVAKRYHQPSDEFDPAWPLTGAAQMIEFVVRIGWEVATNPERPVYKPGREVRIPE